jgi:hypothetical protein
MDPPAPADTFLQDTTFSQIAAEIWSDSFAPVAPSPYLPADASSVSAPTPVIPPRESPSTEVTLKDVKELSNPTAPFKDQLFERLYAPIDAWQAVPDVEPPMPVSLEYQPYSFADLWVNGSAPMFNEDFDIAMIPPISIEVPKFDCLTQGVDQPYSWANAPDLWVNGSAPTFNDDFELTMIPPIPIEVPKFDGLIQGVNQPCGSDFLSAQTGEQDGDDRSDKLVVTATGTGGLAELQEVSDFNGEARRREQGKGDREERKRQRFDTVVLPVHLLRVCCPVCFAFVSMI